MYIKHNLEHWNHTKKRKVKLQNYKTGEIVEANSICEFCEKVGLRGNHKFHITPVLDGERFHHFGWALPSDLDEEIILEDIHGHEYRIKNLIHFCKEHGIGIRRLKKLIGGEITHFNGLYIKGKRPANIKPETRKFIVSFEKNGNVIKTENIAATSRMIHIGKYTLYSIAKGKQSKSRGGWKVKSIELKKKNRLYSPGKINQTV